MYLLAAIGEYLGVYEGTHGCGVVWRGVRGVTWWSTLGYFLVPLRTLRYFDVLLGTFSYFWALQGTSGYFEGLHLPSSPRTIKK